MHKTNNGYGFVSLTDERMVVDIPLPGFLPANVSVAKVNAPSLKNVGRFLKVRATYEFDLGDDGEKKAKVGYDQVVDTSVKEDIDVREDFDITRATASLKNGLLRIEVPKVAEAMGSAVTLT